MTACSEISSQLAALSAEIAALDNRFIPRSERGQIIDESVNRSYSFIMPETRSYTDGRISVVNAAIATVSALVFALQSLVEGLQAAIAGFQFLFSLPGRISSLEGRVGNNENAISGLRNLLDGLRTRIAEVAGTALLALDTGRRAENKAERAQQDATEGLARAAQALAEAREARRRADNAQQEVDNLENFVNPLPARIDEARRRADQAQRDADEAERKADDAIRRLIPIPGQIERAQSTADNALSRASNAQSTADNALGRASNAQSTADNALGRASNAQSTADNALGRASNAQSTADNALSRASNAQSTADNAQGTANQAQGTAQNAFGAAGAAMAVAIQALNRAFIPGPQGIRGERGATGLQGIPGRDGIDGRDGVDAEVDQESKELIRRIAGQAQFIPALVARPAPLNFDQTINAAATGVCRTTQPGGCTANLANNVGDTVRANSNANTGTILSAINAGSNAAQLEILGVINTKLGEQITGGIGGKLVDGFKWLQLDRALNLLTFAATVHNGIQLSNQLRETLGTATGNILTIIGIKDDAGNALNVNEIIGNSVENIVKGIVGEENYTNLTTNWAKANRIYQAGTNVLNIFQDTANTILDGLQLVLGRVGKIGNALRASGEVLENAYQWMNPDPKINRITTTLERLNEGASTVEQITQAPISATQAVTELQTANTEFLQALRDDNNPANRATPEPEPRQLKADKDLEEQNSPAVDLNLSDFDPS